MQSETSEFNFTPEQLSTACKSGLPAESWQITVASENARSPSTGAAILIRYLGSLPKQTIRMTARFPDHSGSRTSIALACATLSLVKVPAGGKVTIHAETPAIADVLSARTRVDVSPDLAALFDAVAHAYDVEINSHDHELTPRMAKVRELANEAAANPATPKAGFSDLALAVRPFCSDDDPADI